MENPNTTAETAAPAAMVPPPNELEIIAGNRAAEARFRNGSTSQVEVRIISIREMPKYMTLLEDECERLEMICNKDAGWADGLTMESHEELIAIGEELNADPFVRWLGRKAKAGQNVMGAAAAGGFSPSDVLRLASRAG